MEHERRRLYFQDNKTFNRIALLRASENSCPPFAHILSIVYSSYPTRNLVKQANKKVIKYPRRLLKKKRARERERERERENEKEKW